MLVIVVFSKVYYIPTSVYEGSTILFRPFNTVFGRASPFSLTYLPLSLPPSPLCCKQAPSNTTIRACMITPKRKMRILLLLLFHLQSVTIIAQTCFNTDTSEVTDGSFQCSPGGRSQHCCPPSSACLDNGLCLFGADGSYNTGSCMDETWTDATCFGFCKHSMFGFRFDPCHPPPYLSIWSS